jgi:hypothetical protein
MRDHVCRQLLLAAAAWSVTAAGMAGPYPPAAGHPGATAVAATDPSIVEWVSGDTIRQLRSAFFSYVGDTASLRPDGALFSRQWKMDLRIRLPRTRRTETSISHYRFLLKPGRSSLLPTLDRTAGAK